MTILLFVVCFTVVFVCSLVALEQIEGLSGGARWLIAACVALMSASGLTSGSAGGSSHAGSELDGLLLPYAALGVTLIVLLILYVLARLLLVIRSVKRRLGRRNAREDRTPRTKIENLRRSATQSPLDHTRWP